MPITYRLFQPGDEEPVVRLCKRVFDEIHDLDPQRWARMEAGSHLTVVAERNGEIVGVIPFDLRRFVLRPGVSIPVAFAHLVGVDSPYRSAGVGSAMMRLAREALADRCDAMFVYTGDEGDPPYTFYERNRFVDLHYARFYRLTDTAVSMPVEVDIQPFDPADDVEQLEVYADCYREYGGFALREHGFYHWALASVIYEEMPTSFYRASLRQDGCLVAYALFGNYKHEWSIFECAARWGDHEAGLLPVIQATVVHAFRDGAREVQMPAGQGHPVRPILHHLGFKPPLRNGAQVIAATLLRPDRIWQALTGGNPTCSLCLWIPGRDEIILTGPEPMNSLEMKPAELERLLLCRTTLAAALSEERITSPDPSLPIDLLADIFRPAPWVYHFLEWT